MRLLVLGGTRFVGRAVVAAALARDWQVTALHRGVTGRVPDGVESILVDRTDPAAFESAVAGRSWDLVVETWSDAPVVATACAAASAGRVQRFGYISSISVYEWGQHTDESSPVAAGDPDADTGDYPALKRGAELGVLHAFPDAILARAGLIVGPHETSGRLPWWLHRISQGGDVVAPGRPSRPLQYVDARDLAAWLLTALADGVTGPVDVVGPAGHATTEGLLQACVDATSSDATLRWFDDQALADAGAQPWTQLPWWVPEGGDFDGFLELEGARARATGLTVRPIGDTVSDTWRWMWHDSPTIPEQIGLPRSIERNLLAQIRE